MKLLVAYLVTALSLSAPRVVAKPTTVPIDRVRGMVQNELLTAHLMLEGGESGGLIRGWNYNSMGIKAMKGQSYMLLKTRECDRRGCEVVKQRFRSFGSQREAVDYYLSMMERRFPEALEAAKDGDVEKFVDKLGDSGYYTDSKGRYLSAMKTKLRRIEK